MAYIHFGMSIAVHIKKEKQIMADVHDVATRSYNMSRIRGKDTKPELTVRKHLHAAGFRYRLHDKLLPGKPDIVLPKRKTVITIHGCFWHGHQGCKFYILPKTRTDWWKKKITDTRERDRKNEEELQSLGYSVITVFECQLKKDKKEETLERLVNLISSELL